MTIQEKFRTGLLELIGICTDTGEIHPAELIDIMEAEIKKMREDNQRVDREGR